MVPELAVEEAQPGADRGGLRRLALWLGRYGIARNAYGLLSEAPSGHMVRCYGLWVDIAGVQHLFGGEAALIRDMKLKLERFGVTARIGLADTFGAAHALGWHGGGLDIAPPGASLQAIAGVPVEGLRLDRASVALLHGLGFKTIGSLAPVPRAALQSRFRGHDEAKRVLLRLDQALGVLDEPHRPLLEAPALSVRQAYGEPLISADGLAREVGSLVGALCQKLQDAGAGARGFRLVLYRSDGTTAAVLVRAARAARAAKHMLGLLSGKLEAVDLGFGVDALVLEARRVEPAPIEQETLCRDGEAVAKEARAQLTDRLVNRLGKASVSQIVLQPSHWPERTAIRVPVLSVSDSARPSLEDYRSLPASVKFGRPPVLLPAPEPITVMAEIPEGAPLRFIWRRARYRIVRAQGPQRLEPEWWRDIGIRAPSALRDYYVIEDESGGRFWVFRAGRYPGGMAGRPRLEQHEGAGEVAPGWFIHGLFC